MASHQLAIARASFAAGLLRPDPTAITGDEVAHFHTLLEKAISQCSPTNIQNCKRWLLKNTICSAARIAAFGKYLVAYSASFASVGDDATASPSRPSAKRKRLHLLYLLNDLLYHTKYRDASSSGYCSLTAKIQSHLVDLFSAAGSYQDCPKHQKKLDGLLDLWEANGYYAKDYIHKLRETVRNAASAKPTSRNAMANDSKDTSGQNSSKIFPSKDTPFVMPPMHGDLSIPYYDLPAGNLLPHIIPNSDTPINPQLVKPLQFVAGPADEKLISAVKDLLQDVDGLTGTNDKADEGIVRDIDELGEPLHLNKSTGEVTGGNGYYGWSRPFCERMKNRGKGDKSHGNSLRGRSESRSRSLSQRKRKRYSYSDSSGSRSRGRMRSYSRSRSTSRERSDAIQDSRRDSPRKQRHHSRSPPHSKSPSARHRRRRSYSQSRSRSYSPPVTSSLSQHSYQPNQNVPHQGPFPFSHPPPPPLPSAPYPGQYQQGFSQFVPPLRPQGMPIPPPPHIPQPFPDQHHINHPGQWPPPPPPPPPLGNFYPRAGQFPNQGPHPPQPPPWGDQTQYGGGGQGYAAYVHGGSQPTFLQHSQQNTGAMEGPEGYRNGRGRGMGPRRGWKT